MFNQILGSGILLGAGLWAVGVAGPGRPGRPAAEARPMVAQTMGQGGPSYQPGVAVTGYYRANGTFVAPHHRSQPDHNFANNWSTAPNVNPYTGRTGTRITPSPSRGGWFRSSGRAR